MTTLKLKIHVKILTKLRSSRTIKKMMSTMNKIYDAAKIDVAMASKEVLNLADPGLAALNDLDIGSCSMGQPTEEQRDLAQFRNGVPDGQIVIFVCNSLSNAYAGCTVIPDPKKPMAALSAKNAGLYTLAHEVGHLLGLVHTQGDDPTLLMNTNGTPSSSPLPAITPSEINQMRNSPFLK